MFTILKNKQKPLEFKRLFHILTMLLIKKDINVYWKNIPWFDFSDSHFNQEPKKIDDWLFKKYNISDDIRKHIEEILPDYYGIR